jgi:hypothetical protein
MSAPSSGEQNQSSEQLEIAQLSTAAREALDYRDRPRTELESGAIERSFYGGNTDEICDLTETTLHNGPVQYALGFPYIVATSKGPTKVGLQVSWAEGSGEVEQTVVSGDRDGQAELTFEGLTIPTITAILNHHVGDPSKIVRKRQARQLVGRLARSLFDRFS